ncbi:MAG TPA: DUF1614 domain-containing protein, partial [Terriglobales bacterium]|nr:DUF1614 domain-containing protein [Terriglobales bacterium]
MAFSATWGILLSVMHYIPIQLPFFIALWVLFGLLAVLIQIGVLEYVFASMGVSRRYMFSLLVGSLLGSYINIPVFEFPASEVSSGRVVEFFGMQYIVPVVVNWPRTVIAVNVGGAVIPFLLSIYLVVKNDLYSKGIVAVALVALVVHMMARPVRGVGIMVPIFLPPLITAVVALSISRWRAAPLAYVAGSMGTLIGADLWNLNKVRGLGAPIASIGGAGKFDGIFL